MTLQVHQFQFNLRTMFVLISLMFVLFVYIGAYYRVSRAGMERAQQEWGGNDGFSYVTITDENAVVQNYRLSLFFFPANLVDQAFFGGASPYKGGIRELS